MLNVAHDLPCHDSQRKSFNRFITEKADGCRNITILPIDEIFEEHTGRWEERGRGWYQRDAVHPNAAGIAAIEICLQQVLVGQPVQPPQGDESSIAYDDVDITWFHCNLFNSIRHDIIIAGIF